MRYSDLDDLKEVLTVKLNMFSSRERLVHLQHGLLTVYKKERLSDQPLVSAHLVESQVTVHNTKKLIFIRLKDRTKLRLHFEDPHVASLWMNTFLKARHSTFHAYYKLGARIGSGEYANVYEAYDKRTGERFAVKVIEKKVKRDPRTQLYIERERDIVRKVNHRSVIKTVDVFENPQRLYIVMEYVSNGNLVSFFSAEKNRINEMNARKLARQILHAVSYLHDRDIIHRDIKAQNVLVTAQGTIKLADFGLARQLDEDTSEEYCLSSVLGTPAYCSPEVISGKPYGKPVDLFACGVLIYIAISGALPFRGKQPAEVFQNIIKGNAQFPEERWAHVSAEARDFVQQLMKTSASKRPTAVEALSHPWLRMSTWNEDRSSRSQRSFVRNRSFALSQISFTSNNSFRRSQRGSLRELELEKIRRRGGMLSECGSVC